jgi:hypothetical protein
MTYSASRVAAIRSFLCFPDQDELVPRGAARLVDFRVLIAYESGMVGSFWSRARSLPRPEEFLEFDHVLQDMSRLGWTTGHATQVAVEELGLNLEAIDHSLDDVSAWNVEAHLASALASLAITSSPGEVAARREGLADAARSRLSAALTSFMAGLDPEILAIVGDGRPVLPSHYNYFAAGDPILRRNRLQGWRTFPLAFRYRTEPLPLSLTVSALSRAIDAGDPLVPTLANRAKVSQAAARAVLCAPPDAAIDPWHCNLNQMGQTLDLVEPAFRPKTGSDWRALHAIARELRNFLRGEKDGGLLRRWLNDIARDGWSVWAGEDAHARGLMVIHETLRGAIEVGVGRTGAPYSAVRQAAFDILGRKRFASAVRLGEAWEEAFQREQDRVVFEDAAASGVQWPVPLATFSTEERTIHAIDTPEGLYTEGTAMNHCVGSYIGECLAGRNQIWSVRTLSGERRSTLATYFAVGKDGAAFVSQHNGPGNSKPDAVSEAAANALVAQLQTMQKELDEFHAWRVSANRKHIDEFANRTGLRISEAALRVAAPELLATVLACRPAPPGEPLRRSYRGRPLRA